LWIVEIGGGAVTACSSESCVLVVNKCILQSKTPSIVTHTTWQYLSTQYIKWTQNGEIVSFSLYICPSAHF
jgi:hypothetical protein